MRFLFIPIAFVMLLLPSFVSAQTSSRVTYTADFTMQNGQTFGWEVLNGGGPFNVAPTGISSVNSMGTELIEVALAMKGARLYAFEMQYTASLAHDVEVWVDYTNGDSNRIIYNPLMTGGDHTVGDTWANNNLLLDVVRLRVVILNATFLAGTEHFHLKRISIEHSGTTPGDFVPAETYQIGVDGLYDALERGNNALGGLPTDLTRPNGVSILPAESGESLFRYVKWIVSPSSADEIAGPFAPIVSHSGIFLTLMFTLSAVYAVVYVASYLIRFAIWLFKIVLAIIQAIIGAIGALLNFLPF
jgi:hypothetical protein